MTLFSKYSSIKKIFNICLLLVINVIFLTTSVIGETSFWKDFENNFSKSKGFQSNFNQEYYDSLQDKIIISKGKFEYLNPGLMKWKYDSPEKLELIIGAEKVWIFDPELENVTIQRLDLVGRIKILAFMNPKESLNKYYDVIKTEKNLLDKSKNNNIIYLRPKDKNLIFKEIQLAVNKVNYQIKQFVILEKQGSYRKITFSKIKTNLNLKPKDFEFIIKEGIEVIDAIDL